MELGAGQTSPLELCQLVNQGLSKVLPQARLLDWEEEDGTLQVRLKLEQSLLMDQGPVLDWFLQANPSMGLALHGAWPTPSGEVWTVQDWNPKPDSMVGELVGALGPLTGLKKTGINIPGGRPEQVHLRLVLPAMESRATIDMSHHPFNAYFRADPVNICFQDHLTERMAEILARPPPLAEQFGVCFPTRIESSEARVVWNPSTWDITLPLNTFWQNYLLPQAVGSRTRVSLTELTEFRPRRRDDGSVATTLAPYPNPGQSLFPSPFTLCSDVLLGDTFLNPGWSYPCLGLIEPQGGKFHLAHAPFLRLEGIEGLGQNISLYLLDSQGRRILPGAESRVWIELSSF